MRKFILIVLISIISTISCFAGVKLSDAGKKLANKEDVEFNFSLRESERACEKLISELPYKYRWSQEFIDGMILVCVSVGDEEVRYSEFYRRMTKCRVENGKMKIEDYTFTIAAVRDLFTMIDARKPIYDMMKEPVLKHNKKVLDGKAALNTKPVASTTSYASNLIRVTKVSDEGKKMIKEFEGLRLKAYWDVNGYSIGYGHHSNVKGADKISLATAEKYFETDIKNCEIAALSLINDLPYKYNFSQGFFDGLCSLIYNCGANNVRKSRFYARLKKCKVVDGEINAKDYNYTINTVKSTYAKSPVHKVRRAKESNKMKLM